ncbi:cyclin-dependent kinase [Zalerion maritima]|uniref:Cyclin-dependent kinase n=1 Tax=Zalerion maritima TaxID=339359 RepID=A0AAD5RUX3_9PEZI|nr:cyclin-dependent kinase [Zalerion maritima]
MISHTRKEASYDFAMTKAGGAGRIPTGQLQSIIEISKNYLAKLVRFMISLRQSSNIKSPKSATLGHDVRITDGEIRMSAHRQDFKAHQELPFSQGSSKNDGSKLQAGKCRWLRFMLAFVVPPFPMITAIPAVAWVDCVLSSCPSHITTRNCITTTSKTPRFIHDETKKNVVSVEKGAGGGGGQGVEKGGVEQGKEITFFTTHTECGIRRQLGSLSTDPSSIYQQMARNLQNRLALAQFKTKHGWEDLTLDKIEPKVEEEIRRKRALEGDGLSDSSSSTSDLPYPSRTLMSSPLKAPATLFSDAITGPSSSSGSTGHRKRTYHAFDSYNAASILSSPTKRFRLSPTAHRSASASSLSVPRTGAGQSTPIKSRRSQHFPPSSAAPSFFSQSQPNFNASLSDSEEDDTLLPAHSFHPSQIARSSPPRTPPPSHRGEPSSRATKSEEGADLLLYLAASPSPAPKRQGGLKSNNSGTSTLMEPPSTPPSRAVRNRGDAEGTPVLPSSMMTPGGLFPATPGPAFDLSDFVNITPSPAQKPWKTPLTSGRTPRVGTTRGKRLTFDDMP